MRVGYRAFSVTSGVGGTRRSVRGNRFTGLFAGPLRTSADRTERGGPGRGAKAVLARKSNSSYVDLRNRHGKGRRQSRAVKLGKSYKIFAGKQLRAWRKTRENRRVHQGELKDTYCKLLGKIAKVR